jgi:hypothetical protein
METGTELSQSAVLPQGAVVNQSPGLAVNPAGGLPQGTFANPAGSAVVPASVAATTSDGKPVPVPTSVPVGRVLSSTQFRTSPAGLKPANPAIDPHKSQVYAITFSSPEVLTLDAPTPGADDEVKITVFNDTAEARILEVACLQSGAMNTGKIAFPAMAGASVTLLAFQGRFNLIAAVGVSIS